MWGLKPHAARERHLTLYKGVICNGVAWSPDVPWKTPTLMLQWGWEGPSPEHSPWAEAGENLSFPVGASPGKVSGKNAVEETSASGQRVPHCTQTPGRTPPANIC